MLLRITYEESVKKLMLFAIDPSDLVTKADYNKKVKDTEKKTPTHYKYIANDLIS